jgi:hypothetical protein
MDVQSSQAELDMSMRRSSPIELWHESTGDASQMTLLLSVSLSILKVQVPANDTIALRLS